MNDKELINSLYTTMTRLTDEFIKSEELNFKLHKENQELEIENKKLKELNEFLKIMLKTDIEME